MEHIEGIKRLIAYIHDFYLEMEEIGDVTLEDITRATFSFYAERMQKGEFLCWDVDSIESCLLYTSPSPRDLSTSRMPSSA